MKKLTAEDPETRSSDVLASNVDQLKALFPEAFTEGAIDFEVLKQLLGGAVDEREEKYGLNWHGKRRARQMALTPSNGTLRPCPEDSVNWNTTQNLMIEGDNLEVLKLLQKSYSGKVKLIYIDPPYNTGKDFVYPDKYDDNLSTYLRYTGQVSDDGFKISSNTETSGRFHTSWLNMMYPRCVIARTLLTPDGVMLISIDEHEAANLRRLMDEVFGEENFISSITWEKGRKNDAKFFSNGHEYVLVYAKSQSYLREKATLWREEKPGARDIWKQYVLLRAKYGDDIPRMEAALQDWYSDLPKTHPAKKWSRYKRIDQYGPWRDRDISWPGGGGPRYEVLHPVTNQPCKIPDAGWRYSTPDEMKRQIKLGLVEFRRDHTEPPFRKAHIRPVPQEQDLDPVDEGEGDSGDEEGEEELATQVRGSYFYKQSQVAVKHLRGLLGTKVFNNPKDVEEIARLVRYTTADDPNAVVLDYFAGSGTTGEAVMRLNSDDGGRRRYLLVQLPEPLDAADKEQKSAARFCENLGRPKNIAEVTKERLRRAAKKLKDEDPTYESDLGFRVFELDTSNILGWEPDRQNLPKSLLDSVEHLKKDRTEQDILYEVLLKLGLDLCVPIEARKISGKDVHSIGGGVLMVCLAETITRDQAESLALGIVNWHKELVPTTDGGTKKNDRIETTCVFRDSAFVDDVAKTNVAAILNQHGLANVRSL
jgi:adenine-specific DNA-methyltransferase